MKKESTIEIGNRYFHLTSEAEVKLQRYLDVLSSHYANEEGVEEILSDIEMRISELLDEWLKAEKQTIVTETHIQKVIETMGAPEELFSEDDCETMNSNQSYPTKIEKRLYRDIDNAVLGGVASGFAAYMGIHPAILRILLVILLIPYGFTFWIYIILWIIIPAARTPIQKLRMKGEPITISKVEQKVKEQYAKYTMSGKDKKPFSRPIKASSHIVTHGQEIVTSVLRVLVFIFAVLMALVSSVVLMTAFFIPYSDLSFFSNFSASETFMGIENPVLVKTAIMMLIYPIFALVLYFAVLILFRLRGRVYIPIVLLVIWLAGIIITVGLRTDYIFGTISKTDAKEEYVLTKTDTLIIQTNNPYKDVPILKEKRGFSVLQKKDSVWSICPIELSIVSTIKNQPLLVYKRSSGANSIKDANNYLNHIVWNWYQHENIVVLDEYAGLNSSKLPHNANISIQVCIPDGQIIKIDVSNQISVNKKNIRNSYDWQLNRDYSYYQMKDGFLVPYKSHGV